MSNSPGLVDFASRLVNFVLNLLDGQVKFFEEFKRRTVKSILFIKMFLGLVEMMFGQVNANFSLPKWQAFKMTFFAPCVSTIIYCKEFHESIWRRLEKDFVFLK